MQFPVGTRDVLYEASVSAVGPNCAVICRLSLTLMEPGSEADHSPAT
jgi:hypothetical protein